MPESTEFVAAMLGAAGAVGDNAPPKRCGWSAVSRLSMGSGQRNADPFLAFLRNIFWTKQPPNIADGLFAAYWTLHQAIRIAPGSVADPKQITVLEKREGQWLGRDVPDTEWGEMKRSMALAEESLRDFKKGLRAAPTPGTQPPPKPMPDHEAGSA